MERWAIVVAAGSGSRFGRPKQLEPLGSTRVIDQSIAALQQAVSGVIVVGPSSLGSAVSLGIDTIVEGGATRSASVRCGLAALPDSATHVLVHDAARPLASEGLVRRVCDALDEGASAVVPVVAVSDTLRGKSGGPVDRDEVVAVQTPQGFPVDVLLDAHSQQADATDDASLIERSGATVVHVDGDSENLKITFPGDLLVAETILAAREGRSASGGAVTRIGQGFDVHPWSTDKSRSLVLGGVHFPDSPGLVGHSDADAIAHACTDAILGAVGMGDIGQMFPDDDESFEDANSIELLTRACRAIVDKGWMVSNVDCTVVLDQPKIAPVRAEMEAQLSAAVGGPVTVKGKRTEGMADLQSGVRCHAVALVVKAQ